MFGRAHLPLLALLAALAASAIAPGDAAARPHAPPPFLDSASASGDHTAIDPFSIFDVEIEALSGPTGENPRGYARWGTRFSAMPVAGPVSCLDVAGDAAVMTIAGPFPQFPGTLGFTVKLVDGRGSGPDLLNYFPVLPELPEYLDCRADPPTDFGGPMAGRVEVVDSSFPPRAGRRCRHIIPRGRGPARSCGAPARTQPAR